MGLWNKGKVDYSKSSGVTLNISHIHDQNCDKLSYKGQEESETKTYIYNYIFDAEFLIMNFEFNVPVPQTMQIVSVSV